MLKLKKIKDIVVEKFLSQIRNSLEQEAGIRASRSEITIIYKDINEVDMKGEVRDALERESAESVPRNANRYHQPTSGGSIQIVSSRERLAGVYSRLVLHEHRFGQ